MSSSEEGYPDGAYYPYEEITGVPLPTRIRPQFVGITGRPFPLGIPQWDCGHLQQFIKVKWDGCAYDDNGRKCVHGADTPGFYRYDPNGQYCDDCWLENEITYRQGPCSIHKKGK